MKKIYIYLTCLTKTIVTSLLSYEELNPIFKIMLTEYSFVFPISLVHLGPVIWLINSIYF